MFRDSLQRRLQEMENENPSPSLKNVKPTLRERTGFLKGYFSGAVEQIPQKEHIFGDLNDELNHYKQSENFDNTSLDGKVRICRNSIERTDYSSGLKDDLQTYLEDALKGENPKNFHYDYFEEMEGKPVPQTIIDMIQQIYFEVAPVEAIKNAISSYKYAQRHWKYASEHAESGAALTTALFSLKSTFDYLIEANFGVEPDDYRQVGDKFFQSAVKLDKLGKKREAQLSIRFALDYYQNGEIPIPEDLRDNWTKYSYGETDNFRTDWQTTNRDQMRLLSS